MWTWLLTPISGVQTHEIGALTAWHGRLMVLGWSIMLPLGMLIARFFKVMPGQDWPAVLDNKRWWRAHVHLQAWGVLVMSVALMLIYSSAPASGAAYLHHVVGWAVVASGWVQLAGGMLRGTKGGPTDVTIRGDHYNMTRRRLVFEYIHKYLGWAVLPLAVLSTGLGLWIADAPRWMPLVVGLWWTAFAGAFAQMQRVGWCMDTYQAIWGPDPIHPGNQRQPIGHGVVRR